MPGLNTEGAFPELPGDRRRQAVPSIRGTVYQAWCSIDAWLQLTTADQVIFLEGAEDFDIVKTDGAITVQVKHNEGSISLGTAKAKEALENFWELATKEKTRQVNFHYLTTSPVAKEQDGTFGAINGLDAWRAACTNTDMAMKVASYLQARLAEGGALRCFIKSASPDDLQNRLFRRFHWLTDQPGIEAVQRSVEDRIIVLLHQHRQGVGLASKVMVKLESHFWRVIVREKSTDRRLTFGDLLRQIEEATTVYLPVPVGQLPELLGWSRPGLGLLKLLTTEVPKPPDPLIQRTELVRQLEQAVNQRRLVLLTGTVFKGKTTVAQLVANTLCPDAWWVTLTDRSSNQIGNLFLALAGEIESGASPSLVVIDDLDIGPVAHRVYRNSLSLVLHRARASGRAVLMTAQGGSSDTAQLSEFPGLEIFEVPELERMDVTHLCVQEGCSTTEADFWGPMVHAFARGHPKLVQVRIAELAKRGWPRFTSTEFSATSPAADSVRQIARRLLSESSAPEVVEFLYCASESTTLLHRSVAIRLAEIIGGIRHPGDLLDGLAGRWLECVEKEWFRTTPLLQGAAGDAWSATQRALAHVRLHDSILSKKTLSPAEAAALLYHAFVGQEPSRIARGAMKLQIIKDAKAEDAVERSLLWLPYVALEEGKRPCGDAVANAAFRGLQFRVAVTLDSDTLPQICARWAEEAAQVLHAQIRQGMQLMMWTSTAIANCAKVPLRIRLDAIQELSGLQLSGEIAEVAAAGIQSFFDNADPLTGMPTSGTSTQVMLALCVRWVRGATALRDVVDWLDLHASDETRIEFDSILEWPIVQSSGAFVHSAWSAVHDSVIDWTPWLELFDFIDEYAKRRVSPALGREAAKAKAIVLTEYLSRADDALQALSEAEGSFGNSPVLDEQRASVLFQVKDDSQVLEIWSKLVANPANRFALSPFAYRRAAMSAARLGKWGKAEEIFRAAIASIEPGSFERMRFGLVVDCSLAASLDGGQQKAAELLADAVASLPPSAAEDGDQRWEALQRMTAEVCRRIENTLWNPSDAKPRFQPGDASSPELTMPESQPGQGMRTAMLRGQVAKLCACLGVSLHLVDSSEVVALGMSRNASVRWLAAKVQLARSFARGAGVDFIPAIVRLDATLATLRRLGEDGFDTETAVEIDQPEAPNQWFGLLVAGACCSGGELDAHLAAWLVACEAAPEILDGVGASVREMQAGVSSPAHSLWEMVSETGNAAGTRCGAAVRLLLQPLPPRKALTIQGLVTSALASDASITCQEVCNRHLALRFANTWEEFARSPFNFRSPRTTVPALHAAIDSVKRGSGTLRTLLTAVSAATGQSIGEFLDRVR